MPPGNSPPAGGHACDVCINSKDDRPNALTQINTLAIQTHLEISWKHFQLACFPAAWHAISMPAQSAWRLRENMPIRHLSGTPGQLSSISPARPKSRYIFIKGSSFTLKFQGNISDDTEHLSKSLSQLHGHTRHQHERVRVWLFIRAGRRSALFGRDTHQGGRTLRELSRRACRAGRRGRQDRAGGIFTRPEQPHPIEKYCPFPE